MSQPAPQSEVDGKWIAPQFVEKWKARDPEMTTYFRDAAMLLGLVTRETVVYSRAEYLELLVNYYRDTLGVHYSSPEDVCLWRNVPNAARSIWTKIFKPLYDPDWADPLKPASMLSQTDIEGVMEQYQDFQIARSARKFKWMGVVYADSVESGFFGRFNTPIIGSVTHDQIARDYVNGYSAYGWVITTNDSTRLPDGRHWVAIYMSFDASKSAFGINYFDSLGNPPNKHISNIIVHLENQLKQFHSRQLVKTNLLGKPLQKNLSPYSCGMFCIVFIKLMLTTGQEMSEVAISPQLADGKFGIEATRKQFFVETSDMKK